MSYSRIASPPLASQQHSSQFMNQQRANFLFFAPSVPSRERPPITAERRRRLLFSYGTDWFLTLALAAIFFSLDKVNGFRRNFSLEDISLRHPFAEHERVPNIALYFICGIAPLVIQPVVNFCTVRSWWDLHNSTLGLVLSLALTGSITQFVKITVGRPRPDIISRCKPLADAVDPKFGLSDWTICTETDAHLMRDGFRSFFSGHSSLSFAGLGFLSFYIAGKLHLFDRRGHASKAWLALSPFFAAALVAISRTMDSRHHWQDVTVGSIVGTTLAYFAYRQYYPHLADELSHRPYSPRIKRDEDTVIPMHYRPSNGSGQQYPFAPGINSSSSNLRYGDGGELGNNNTNIPEGTAPRPSVGPMEEVWKQRGGIEDGQKGLTRSDSDEMR